MLDSLLKMSRMQRRRKDLESRNQIAQTVKQRLGLLVSFLSIILVIMIFRVGQVLWPLWMVEYRPRIVAILLLAIICLILLSPIIVEASSNTRTLSGPGDSPPYS